MRSVRQFLVLLFLSFGVSLSSVFAQFDPFNPPGQASANSTLTFVSEVSTIKPGEPFHVAIKLDHPKGWHSYYVNPGFLGFALNPDWKLPKGFEAERVSWPVPHIGMTAGKKTYGYEPAVTHIFKISPPSNLEVGSDITITTDASWQICDDNSCVQEPPFTATETEHSLELSVGSASEKNASNAKIFSEGRAQLPKKLPADIKVEASKNSLELSLLISPASAVDKDKLYFFAAAEMFVDAEAEPVIEEVEGGAIRWTIKRAKGEKPPKVEKLEGILTVGKESYLIDTEFGKAAAAPVGFGKLMGILGGMFVGGMILNLMPCVFPVIGLKIMSFVQQAGENRRHILNHGLIYAGGVVLSFWVLAGLLLGLREGAFGSDTDVSWGYQLQNPWVVWILMLVMFVLAMNMYGVFEIGTSATSVGSNLTQKQGPSGSFFSGVLATVVATPCSAPFLGVAIGLAFTLSPFLFMLAFTVMAAGLAFPYVLLSAFPKLVEKLPRPGAWMESFKQAMSFLLFGTAGFLLWIYEKHIDYTFTIVAILGLTSIGIALWIYGRWCTIARAKKTRRIGFTAAAIFAVLGLTASKPPDPGLDWQAWTPEKVEEALAEGRPVYVDFTASWCATCQVNKAVAYKKEVREIFEAHNILALKADHTKRDPEIDRAISELGRNALPVNVLYLSGDSDPKLTKELLSSGYLVEFITEHLGEAPKDKDAEE